MCAIGQPYRVVDLAVTGRFGQVPFRPENKGTFRPKAWTIRPRKMNDSAKKDERFGQKNERTIIVNSNCPYFLHTLVFKLWYTCRHQGMHRDYNNKQVLFPLFYSTLFFDSYSTTVHSYICLSSRKPFQAFAL